MTIRAVSERVPYFLSKKYLDYARKRPAQNNSVAKVKLTFDQILTQLSVLATRRTKQ